MQYGKISSLRPPLQSYTKPCHTKPTQSYRCRVQFGKSGPHHKARIAYNPRNVGVRAPSKGGAPPRPALGKGSFNLVRINGGEEEEEAEDVRPARGRGRGLQKGT